jgi:hypothetical protein
MNKRIRQLADEATAYADTLDVADQKIYQEIRDREFAELIVRECIDYCGDNLSKTVGGALKIHFGVKE